MAQGAVGHDTRAARNGIWANLVYNIIWILALPSLIGILGLVLYPPDQFADLLGGDGTSSCRPSSPSTSRRGCW